METKDGKDTIKEYNTTLSGKIVATCNGLIVLKENNPRTRLIILNPVTRELEDIPLGTKTSLPTDSYGLAFCHVSRRYKLLHLFMKDRLSSLGCEIIEIECRTWRAVDVPPIEFERRFDLLECPVFAMGALHWFQNAVDRGDECMVISMSLDDEKYKTMAIPETNHSHFKSVFAMGEFLGFAGQLLQGASYQMGVWILRGLECDWEKQYNIDSVSGLGFYSTSLVYYGGVDGHATFIFNSSCDHQSRLMRKIETADKWAATFFTSPSFPHVNSLVSWRS